MSSCESPDCIPESYETLKTTHVTLSHYPGGARLATPVILVTLNRPASKNAFTLQMAESLETVYRLFDLDQRVKVIVLTGAGTTFCAGADLDIGFGGSEERIADHRDGGGRASLAIHHCRKPTIAAMQGSAVGIGMTMTLPAAIRIGCEKAKYGFVFSRRGLTMEACSHYFLPRLIGYSNAMYLITTGAVYHPSARQLRDLFNEVMAEPSQVLPRALELATDIAENTSSLATCLNRMLIWRGADTAEGAHLLDSRLVFHMFGTKDLQEGVSAFLEKRKPHFTSVIDEDGPSFVPWWREIDTRRKTKRTKASKI